jgi:hypothetical protein
VKKEMQIVKRELKSRFKRIKKITKRETVNLLENKVCENCYFSERRERPINGGKLKVAELRCTNLLKNSELPEKETCILWKDEKTYWTWSTGPK